MREVVFHAELLAALRAAGCWAMKWPDQAVSRMQLARDGKLRFVTPKPCDLVGCRAPDGQLLAIEAKLLRARTFRIDDRLLRQWATLRELAGRGAWIALALNFRFESKRPPERINRSFLLTRVELELERGAAFTLNDAEVLAVELPRITGGWRLPAVLGLGGSA